MKNGWKRQPFEDCIERATYTQKIQRKDFLADGPYPVISQEEDFINGYWDNEADIFKVTTPIVVFGDHTKVLKYVDFDFVLGADGVKILQPREFLLPKFFFYQLQAANLDSLGYARHYRLLKELEIAYPGRPEQHRIVGILDKAFEGIATAKANAEKNLQNARALFESYLQSVFTQRGEGWVDRRLGDIAETQYGLSEPMNEEGKGFKIFRMGEVQGGRLIDTGRMKYADIDRAEFDKYKLQLGDVLFNRTNSFELVGKTGIFDLPGDYCFASYLVRVLLNPKIMQPAFLNYFMNSERFQKSVKQKASKSINQANINATILSNEFVRFPESLKEQKIIVTCLDSLRAETQRLATLYERKLASLEELKKSLLHQAFSGRL